jgi:protein-tyrosine phosphatase
MPALTEVVFLSQELAEAYLPGPNEAIISITDHSAQDANLKDGWHAVLRLSFDDVDPIESPIEPGEEDLIEMLEHQADRTAAFVRDNSRVVGTLVVHCKYGQSRSAGVAKAIASHHGLEFPAGYTYANNHVYELVLKSLRRLSVA